MNAMRFVSFLHEGNRTFGLVTFEGLVDLGPILSPRHQSLRSLISDPAAPKLVADALEHIGKTRISVEQVRYLPVVPDAAKIFCIGTNYAAHAEEAGIAVAERPTVFMRYASSQVGHGEPLLLPRESQSLDFEGELAVVIGQGGHRIAPERGWEHVFGCACYNDGSVRDWQMHSSQWGPGKNFLGTGAFGPWLVTRDEVDPEREVLSLTTRVNGHVMQQDTTDHMIHKVPALISYCSTVLPLEPGDVIVTGTPSGIGMTRHPPIYLREGDIVEIEITGLGCLRNTVQRD